MVTLTTIGVGMVSGATDSPADKSWKDDAFPPVTPKRTSMPVVDEIELSSESGLNKTEAMPSLLNDTNHLRAKKATKVRERRFDPGIIYRLINSDQERVGTFLQLLLDG
jgi:hypothetical protein